LNKIDLVDIEKTYVLEDKKTGKLITTPVLRGVNISFAGGELHTLLGENGAGKSTLVHILSGSIPQSSGRILLDEKEVRFASARHAIDKGILIVQQALALSPEASVFEQLMLENEGEGWLALANKKKLEASLLPFFRMWGVEYLSLERKIASLSREEKFFLSLASKLYKHPKMLILDESSSLLPSYKRDLFFARLKLYAKTENIALLAITHDIDEAIATSDTITVIREGRNVATFELDSLQKEMPHNTIRCQIEKTMLNLEALSQFEGAKNKSVVSYSTFKGLSIEIECNTGDFEEIHIQAQKGRVSIVQFLKRGEIQEIEDVISGMKKKSRLQGKMCIVQDECLKFSLSSITPKLLLQHKIGFIPSDRYYRASHPNLSIEEVLSCYEIDRFSASPFIDKNKQNEFVSSILKQAGIPASAFDACSTLSGGQLQRIILLRCLTENPDAIILAEPMRGLDVLSMKKFGASLQTLASAGKTILIFTQEEHNEVYACICDDVFRL